MCCFSGPVSEVENTHIFARFVSEGRQLIVYQMNVTAAEPVAMILPIPVKQPAKEDAVKFIDLKEYRDFFYELSRGWPRTGAAAPARPAQLEPTLPVIEVGDFVASFVPTLADFARVDKRFRLPPEVWSRIPRYKDFGFTVFQLKAGKLRVHPMAFEFPTRYQRRLFIPTMHIHDGGVHPNAQFHHWIYCQTDEAPTHWEESSRPLGTYMTKLKQFPNLVDPEAHVHRRVFWGTFQNVDVIV
jgi:hypothetical protein